jgi:hypothetical protein
MTPNTGAIPNVQITFRAVQVERRVSEDLELPQLWQSGSNTPLLLSYRPVSRYIDYWGGKTSRYHSILVETFPVASDAAQPVLKCDRLELRVAFFCLANTLADPIHGITRLAAERTHLKELARLVKDPFNLALKTPPRCLILFPLCLPLFLCNLPIRMCDFEGRNLPRRKKFLLPGIAPLPRSFPDLRAMSRPVLGDPPSR